MFSSRHIGSARLAPVASVLAAIMLLLASSLGAVTASASTSASNTGPDPSVIEFTAVAGTNPPPAAITIPYWTGSFTDAKSGTTYAFRMVGTDPGKGAATTTVPVVIVPLKFVFHVSDTGVFVMDGSQTVATTLASPIFNKAPYNGSDASMNTQYGDAVQKASLWGMGSSNSGYHVLLGKPAVLATQTIDVPSDVGKVQLRNGHSVGMLDYTTYRNLFFSLMKDLNIPATSLAIFVTFDTGLGSVTNYHSIVLGIHGVGPLPTNYGPISGNGQQPIPTWIFAAYITPGTSTRYPTAGDIHGLSHEVSEWIANPFVTNTTDVWQVPGLTGACGNSLEVGDAIAGYDFPVTLGTVTYHPQDELFLSWFAHQSPSIGLGGRYTFQNSYTTYAPACGS